MQNEWRDFNGGAWENEVNVRDFIQRIISHTMVTALFGGTDRGYHSTLAGRIRAFKAGERGRRRARYGYKDHFHDHFPWTCVLRQR